MSHSGNEVNNKPTIWNFNIMLYKSCRENAGLYNTFFGETNNNSVLEWLRNS